MTWRISGSPVLLAVLLIVGSVPLGSVGAAQDHAFEWQSARGFEGPLAVDLTFHFPQATTCSYDVEAVWVEDEPAPFGFMFTLGGPAGETWVMSGGTSRDSYVHVEDHVDTRSEDGPGRGEWFFGIESSRSLEAGESLNLTAVSPYFQTWDNDLSEVPLSIEMDCDGPFSVDKQAGHEVSFFDQHGFDGGASASVSEHPPGVPFLPVSANAAVDERREVTLDESNAVLRVRGHQFTMVGGVGGVLAGAAAGQFALEHPEGESSWPFSFRPVIDYADPGGEHEMRLTRTAATSFDTFGGMLVGVGPVETLNAANGGAR